MGIDFLEISAFKERSPMESNISLLDKFNSKQNKW